MATDEFGNIYAAGPKIVVQFPIHITYTNSYQSSQYSSLPHIRQNISIFIKFQFLIIISIKSFKFNHNFHQKFDFYQQFRENGFDEKLSLKVLLTNKIGMLKQNQMFANVWRNIEILVTPGDIVYSDKKLISIRGRLRSWIIWRFGR